MNTLTESFALAFGLITRLDGELFKIVALSLQVSSTACLIGAVLGLWLGAWLAVVRFPGHGLMVWAVNTLLALPPVVAGLLVYLLLSRSGPLGALGILFTPPAMVLVQSVLVVPLIAALSMRLVRSAVQEGGDQLRSLGASPVQCALLMLVHERLAVLTILLTAFGRAVAEVGAVMIVGGNIDGVTRVMTTAIALETSKGDLPLALALGIVLLGVVGLVNGLIGGLQMRPVRTSLAGADGAALPVPGLAPIASGPGRAGRPATAAGEPLLSVEGATVRFDGRPALRQASFALRRGDCVALVGANGSGKTTLLRLLHGLLSCDEGRVERHALRAEARLPSAAMLFQRPFLMNLSVRRNVWLGLWLRGVAPGLREARCADALRRVGLEALRDRPARALSGGQQQRLALARAWALQPDLLFLDEPTASLDPSAKREIETLLEAIGASGVTIVMSTHNLGQVKRLASRVVYLEAGRLIVDLPTDRFFADELPPEAAQFMRGELPWV